VQDGGVILVPFLPPGAPGLRDYDVSVPSASGGLKPLPCTGSFLGPFSRVAVDLFQGTGGGHSAWEGTGAATKDRVFLLPCDPVGQGLRYYSTAFFPSEGIRSSP